MVASHRLYIKLAAAEYMPSRPDRQSLSLVDNLVDQSSIDQGHQSSMVDRMYQSRIARRADRWLRT